MLRAVSDCGGEATTSEIRDVTGLSNSQVAYRRDKLTEYGLLEVRTGEPTGSRTPPKVHSLTESARSQIDSGLFELYNAPVTSDVEQLSTQYNHLRDRVDDLAQTVASLEGSLATVNTELSRLEGTIAKTNAELDERVGDADEIESATDEETVAGAIQSLSAELAELREEVDELDERKKNKFFG